MTGEIATSIWGLGYELTKLVFKKFPSCALTAGNTDVMLRLIAKEDLPPMTSSASISRSRLIRISWWATTSRLGITRR